MSKPHIAIVVKYYPPLTRISGIVTFVSLLARHLAARADVSVVTYRPARSDAAELEIDGCAIHRVDAPFPLTAGRKVRSLRPDVTLVVSGVHDLRKAVPYFAAFDAAAGRGGQRVFFQATNVGGAPSSALARVLDRYDTILCASTSITERFAPRFGERVVMFLPAVDVEQLAAVDGRAARRVPHRLRESRQPGQGRRHRARHDRAPARASSTGATRSSPESASSSPSCAPDSDPNRTCSSAASSTRRPGSRCSRRATSRCCRSAPTSPCSVCRRRCSRSWRSVVSRSVRRRARSCRRCTTASTASSRPAPTRCATGCGRCSPNRNARARIGAAAQAAAAQQWDVRHPRRPAALAARARG